MKNSIIIIALFFSIVSFSQEDKENYKREVLKFQSFYNEGNYEAIFNMFDANMKSDLPLENTLQFFKKNVSPAGKIESMEFYKTKQTAHIYKTTFENSVLDISISLGKSDAINGLFIAQHIPENLPKLERNITKMILPFNEEWLVFWGGKTVEQNYHVDYENQKYAYDIVMVQNGASYKSNSKKNENYFVFGKDIIAPCDAKVVKVITGVHDNVPGELNSQQITGNMIVIETENKEFLVFAHLKEQSIVVKEGQEVKQGDLLGQCGNSGNTSEPHLHLSLQNVIDMNQATGAKLYFDEIKVNGKIKQDYLPVKEDKIQNIKF